jgi:hypothetical protein
MVDSFVDKKAEDVINLFSNVKPNKGRKGGFFVSCPFHGSDSDPSLHIYDSEVTGNHKLMVKCFGCDVSPRTILDFINSGGEGVLSTEELIALANGTKKAKHVEDVPLTLTNTYSYNSPEGELLYQVLRFEPKTFRYRRPATQEELDDTGKPWVYGLSGFSPTLYNLDLVRYAHKDNKIPVFVLEGEGKCDLVRKHKLIATTNSFGGTTGKWKPEYADLLKGLDVIIIPDNDLTGYNHVYEVFESLLGKAKSIKIVTLPRVENLHDDIKDWFNVYGGTREELLSLVSSAEDLSTKDVDYVKSNFKFNFEDSEQLSVDLSALDSLVVETAPSDSQYSEKLLTFLQMGRELLDAEGEFVGLCTTCLNTGFVLTKNDDGMIAAAAYVYDDSSENGNAVSLNVCNHGNYDENPDDFKY